MSDNLFALHGNKANQMKVVKYSSEDVLQLIIAENPNLLSRAWDSEHQTQLYLVKREQTAKIAEDHGNSFSLDHLMVDEEGIPVLVEVKRSTDTRIRREVAAQMLDYACRASTWTTDELRNSFLKNNPDLEDDDRFDVEFWNKVSDNLKSDKMRLVFAADEIPETLRVLIEFMDRTMKDIEVYGVELKQYKAGETTLLAKRVVGNSLLTNPKPATTLRWKEDSVPVFLKQVYGDWALELFYQVKEEMASHGYALKYGNDAKYASLRFYANNNRIFSFTANNERASIAFNTGAIVALSKGELVDRLLGFDPNIKEYNDKDLVYQILRLNDSFADIDKRNQFVELLLSLKETPKSDILE